MQKKEKVVLRAPIVEERKDKRRKEKRKERKKERIFTEKGKAGKFYPGSPLKSRSASPMPIYDAAMLYQQSGTPLLVIAGKDYGSGSSRDWAAKGTRLLGVSVVIA